MTPLAMMVAGLIGVKASDKGKDLEREECEGCAAGCPECCLHRDTEHGICIDCGKDCHE